MSTKVDVDERLPHSAARYLTGCRCLFCIDGYESHVQEEQRRVQRIRSRAPHGTVDRLLGGCRCQACRHARREISRDTANA